MAVRHHTFRYAWRPVDQDSPADRRAAYEAAKLEAETKAMSLSNRKIPYAICVLQDEWGNAIGGLSIRGKSKQQKFQMKIGSRQRQRLADIPEENRGRGHGWCAEQPATHNASVIRQHQRRNNMEEGQQMFLGQCTITAYRRHNSRSTTYDERIPACPSCQVTNEMYDFEDDSYEVSISTESSEKED